MFKTVLVENATWEIDEEDIKEYGGYENAKDELGLPDGFSLDVEDENDIDEAVRNAAYDKYEVYLDDFDYEVIDDDDDDYPDDEDADLADGETDEF